MLKIDKVAWGKIKVDGQKFGQVLIIGDDVKERNRAKLKKIFGTTHRLGDWEQRQLLSQKPDLILVATGWSGVLKVSPEFKDKAARAGAELKSLLTPKAVRLYNQLVKEGKRVNALIHTTC